MIAFLASSLTLLSNKCHEVHTLDHLYDGWKFHDLSCHWQREFRCNVFGVTPNNNPPPEFVFILISTMLHYNSVKYISTGALCLLCDGVYIFTFANKVCRKNINFLAVKIVSKELHFARSQNVNLFHRKQYFNATM